MAHVADIPSPGSPAREPFGSAGHARAGASPSFPGSAASPPFTVSRTGRLRHEELSEADRNYAVAIHLSPFTALFGIGIFAVIIPIVLWLIRREQSVFVDDHGRDIINFGLSQIVLSLLLVITMIGAVLLPVLWLVGIISLIRAAVAAGQGEYFRYPLTFRFLP